MARGHRTRKPPRTNNQPELLLRARWADGALSLSELHEHLSALVGESSPDQVPPWAAVDDGDSSSSSDDEQ